MNFDSALKRRKTVVPLVEDGGRLLEQFTSNSSDTANPLLKEPNPADLYLIPREESGSEKTGKLRGKGQSL